MQQRLEAWLESKRAQRWMGGLVLALALLFLGLFLYAAVKRMRYPFEVEWIESGMLVSVLRIVHGQGLYVAPSLEFVPYLYTPLYLYAAAAVERLLGAGAFGGSAYGALRLVSTLSTLGSCAAIALLVRSETGRRLPAVAGATLYLACYSVTGGFFDIGRVDSLFVLLLLLALLAQRRGHPVLAALVWVLVFQTKQTVLPLAVLVLCAEWPRPRRALAAVSTFLAAAGASVLLLNHLTGGWYGFYVFHVAGGLPVVARQLVLYLPVMVLEPMVLAWALVLVAGMVAGMLAGIAARPRLRLRESPLRGADAAAPPPVAMFYAFTTVALLGGVWFVEAHRGASMNAMMPVYAWAGVLFGVAMASLLDRAEAAGAPRLALAVTTAVALQLVALIYNPGRYVPPQTAVERSQRFVAELRALPGDVYVLNHTYDAMLAGKPAHAEGEALGAVLDAGADAKGERLRQQLDQAMAEHRYTAVVVDDLSTTETSWHFERAYPLEISTGLSGFRYLTSQPQWFLLPCEAAPAVKQDVLRPDAVESDEGCPQGVR